MEGAWNGNSPIYRQLRDLVVARILDGTLKEGDPVPSVRQVAAEYRINHLTVLKAWQQLVDEDVVESRRGLGMFVRLGARALLLRHERDRFLSDDWPRMLAAIERLGFSADDLLQRKVGGESPPDASTQGG